MTLKVSAIAADIIHELYSSMMEELFSSDSEVNSILDHVLETRGKGIRPTFMTLVADLVGGSRIPLRKAAILIETIHVSSLLHDDVLDSSGLRRGVETLNAKYSDKVSVLSGDFIFVKAMKIAHEMENPEVMSIILWCMERMVKGEIRDSLTTGVVDEETYLSIAADKTAALFAASGELGVLLSGGSGIERVWGRNLGEYAGTAFQIVDDTLDYLGDASQMGKPGLMDVMARRMTLPLIHSLRGFETEEIEEMLNGEESSAEKLSALVRTNGGIEYALGRARDYLENARVFLRHFKKREAQNSLDEFLEELVARRF